MRDWINNQSFWQKSCQFNNRQGNHLDHDLRGAFGIEFYLGHWQGQGEPYSSKVDHPGPGGGNWIDLLDVLDDYHEEGPGKTFFRKRWEQIVLHPAFKNPPFSETPVQSTRDMQSITDFICVKINRVRDATSSCDIDPGKIDEADFYTTANIAGQEFHSGNIHGYDTFDFPTPNYPFTFLKALPKGWQIDEPVTTLQIEVSTANMSYAGTDDEVFFRINNNTRFLLDKPLYDDFEKGDSDTYSLNPPEGLRICDIEYIQIEKASDGAGGGWKLGGIKVFVNRRQFYQNNNIHQWLQDNNLTWRALDFFQQSPTTNEIPITIRLYDDDRGFLDWRGCNDHCDINPDYDRYDLNLLYNMNSQSIRGDITGIYRGNSLGGSLLGGGGSDDDEAEISFRIENFTVTPPPLNTGILESSYASSSHEVPDAFNLYQNYPNPFNSTTLIQYELPNETRVVLKIYNIIGQEVLPLVNEHQTAGFKYVVWDGKDNFGLSVNSGIYIYSLQAGDEIKSRRMVYQK